MAAVEITQQVIKCDDPDWKSWALQYSLKVGDAGQVRGWKMVK